MIALARDVLDVLLASIWQGACIALVAGTILAVAGGRLNAATRYVILQCVLVTIVLLPLITALPAAFTHPASIVQTPLAGASPMSNGSNLAPASDVFAFFH